VAPRLARLGKGPARGCKLGQRSFIVGDRFTVVDAYLFVMLTWARKQGVRLPPELERYADALSERAAIKEALEMESGRGRPAELFAHSSSAEHER